MRPECLAAFALKRPYERRLCCIAQRGSESRRVGCHPSSSESAAQDPCLGDGHRVVPGGVATRENTVRTSTPFDRSNGSSQLGKLVNPDARKPIDTARMRLRGLVDCVVRGGSSPLGRIEKALQTGDF